MYISIYIVPMSSSNFLGEIPIPPVPSVPGAYQVEQQVLRRHQTAPAKSAVDDVETDSEDEGVTVPKAW